MSEQRKLSTTFRLLRALGFNYSEEAYGDVTIGKLFGKIGKRKGTMNVLTEEDFL